MLYACDQKFDVTENLENFCELNKASVTHPISRSTHPLDSLTQQSPATKLTARK